MVGLFRLILDGFWIGFGADRVSNSSSRFSGVDSTGLLGRVLEFFSVVVVGVLTRTDSVVARTGSENFECLFKFDIF